MGDVVEWTCGGHPALASWRRWSSNAVGGVQAVSSDGGSSVVRATLSRAFSGWRWGGDDGREVV